MTPKVVPRVSLAANTGNAVLDLLSSVVAFKWVRGAIYVFHCSRVLLAILRNWTRLFFIQTLVRRQMLDNNWIIRYFFEVLFWGYFYVPFDVSFDFS